MAEQRPDRPERETRSVAECIRGLKDFVDVQVAHDQAKLAEQNHWRRKVMRLVVPGSPAPTIQPDPEQMRRRFEVQPVLEAVCGIIDAGKAQPGAGADIDYLFARYRDEKNVQHALTLACSGDGILHLTLASRSQAAAETPRTYEVSSNGIAAYELTDIESQGWIGNAEATVLVRRLQPFAN